MTYCVDTSALMDGWRRWYPHEAFPSLWKELENLVAGGELIAPDEVLEELKKKEDDLFKWAKSQKKLFHVLDAETQVALREVMAQFPRLVNTQKERSTADPVVIALARVKSFAVITGEKAAGNDARPRIPNVCDFYSVRHLTLPELIRERRWRF